MLRLVTIRRFYGCGCFLSVFLLAIVLIALFPWRPAAANSDFRLPALTSLSAVAYGNGIYLVIGDYCVNDASPPVYNSVVLASLDGTTWTMQPVFDNIFIHDIAYGKGLFVAVGGVCVKATGVVLTSSDGVHWNQNSFGSNTEFYNVAYGNGRFVLTGYNAYYTSTDGLNWTPVLNRPPFNAGLIFSNGVFMNFSDGTQFATSPDGVNWQRRDMGVIDNNGFPGQGIRIEGAGAACGNGMYIVAGTYNSGDPLGGETPVVITSFNAAKWTMTVLHPDSPLKQLTFGNGIFAAAGINGEIFTSPDGATWAIQDTGARAYYATVSYCNDKFVALGSGGTISTSSDGGNWMSSPREKIPGSEIAIFHIGQNSYYVGYRGSGDTQVSMDAAPFIAGGRTLVPVRYLAYALEAQTAWDGTGGTVTITSGSTTISMAIGSTTLTVNGQAQTMDIAPVIRADRTYLPARYLAEALGCSVLWDAGYQTVTVTQGD